jgi:flagellar hook assembly protein FlgD
VQSGSYYVSADIVDSYGNHSVYNCSVVVIRQDSAIWVEVYNSAGELVNKLNSNTSSMGAGVVLSSGSLVQGQTSVKVSFGSASATAAVWDGSNAQGVPVAGGNYTLKIYQQRPDGVTFMTSKQVIVIPAPDPGSAPPYAAPNPGAPSDKGLTLYIPGATAQSRPTARIHNLAGELVGEISGAQGQGSLRWNFDSDISAGVYIASISLEEFGKATRRWKVKVAVIR